MRSVSTGDYGGSSPSRRSIGRSVSGKPPVFEAGFECSIHSLPAKICRNGRSLTPVVALKISGSTPTRWRSGFSSAARSVLPNPERQRVGAFSSLRVSGLFPCRAR
jgi:hypothetical protein